MTNLQFGHLCFTFCRLSTQRGAKKHGQNPVKQRIALRVQAITPAVEEVEVVMELRQLARFYRQHMGASEPESHETGESNLIHKI